MRHNLKSERMARRLTHEKTANLIGKTTRHYKALEAGTSNGSMKVWEKLKELFGKPIDYLSEQVADDTQHTNT